MCENSEFIQGYKFVLYNFLAICSLNLYWTNLNGELSFLKSSCFYLHFLQMLKRDFFSHEAISLGFLFSSYWSEHVAAEG